MPSTDRTLKPVRWLPEAHQVVAGARLRRALSDLFNSGLPWDEEPVQDRAADALGSVDAYQLKLLTTAYAAGRRAVAIILTDTDDASVWRSGLGRVVSLNVDHAHQESLPDPSRRKPLSEAEKVEWDLRRARAMRELAEVDSRRAIWNAFDRGLSQRETGDLVGRSQPDIGRTIKKVDSDPGLLEVTPREICLRRLVGEYSDAEMMARLVTWTYTEGTPDPSPLGTGYIPGTWDQIRRLRDEELISEAEWQELFRAEVGADTGPATVTLPGDDE